MQSKQRGSFLIGGIAALMIAGIIGFIGYSHGSSKKEAETERMQGLLNAKIEEAQLRIQSILDKLPTATDARQLDLLGQAAGDDATAAPAPHPET